MKTPSRVVSLLAATLLAVTSRANAQQTLGSRFAASTHSARALRDASPDASPDESPDRWHLSHCIAGVTYGAPLKFALAYGGGMLRESDGKDVCALGVAKVGLGGALAGIGLGTTLGPLGGGAMLTGNVLRTFASPLHATPRRTYVGASLHLWPALAFGGEIGYYTRIGDASGATSSGKHVVSWSVGFGY